MLLVSLAVGRHFISAGGGGGAVAGGREVLCWGDWEQRGIENSDFTQSNAATLWIPRVRPCI